VGGSVSGERFCCELPAGKDARSVIITPGFTNSSTQLHACRGVYIVVNDFITQLA